jgi:hypothetical protein
LEGVRRDNRNVDEAIVDEVAQQTVDVLGGGVGELHVGVPNTVSQETTQANKRHANLLLASSLERLADPAQTVGQLVAARYNAIEEERAHTLKLMGVTS